MSILQRTADAEVAIENARRLERDGKGYDGRLPDGGRSAETTAALIVAAFAHGDVGRMAAAARRAYELENDPDSPLQCLVNVLYGVDLYFAGEPEDAIPVLERAAALSRLDQRWGNETGSSCLRAWAALDQGETDVALQWAHRAADVSEAGLMTDKPSGGYVATTFALVSASNGAGPAAIADVDEQLEIMRQGVEPLILAQCLIALAALHLEHGESERSRVYADEASEIFEEFVDPGMLGDRLASLKSAIDANLSAPGLTAKEYEVLEMLRRGLTKRQVADELYVSFNTVHSHTKSIYRKLGVSTRKEALVVARSLESVNSPG